MKTARARSPDRAYRSLWGWLLDDRRGIWLACWALLVLAIASLYFILFLASPSFYTDARDPARRMQGSRQRSGPLYSRSRFRDITIGKHLFYRRTGPGGFNGAAGAARTAGVQDADLPVHTARISAEDGLPEGAVRRADVPAILSYQLKPAGELAAGEVANEAAATLLDALAGGATISVTFGCSHCDDPDQRQAPQHLRLEPTPGGTSRTQPLFFRFTPRSRASGLAEALDVTPFVSLTFRVDGHDVDRWTIPVTILAAATEPPRQGAQLSRTVRRTDRGPSENAVTIQYSDHPVHGSRAVAIEVYAPRELRAYFAPLEEAGGEARITGTSPAGITYSLSDLSMSLASIQSASDQFLGEMDRAFRFAINSSERFPHDHDCPVIAQEAEDQRRISAGIRTCILSEARTMSQNMLPEPLQRVLFNLARCQPAEGSGARERPLVVISGIHHGPIQFLPVDDLGAAPDRCSATLQRRPQSQAANSTPSDDFLGLLLPIVIQPQEVASALSGDTPVASAAPRRGATILAGVYDGTREDRVENAAYGFDEFARFAATELQAVVTRNSNDFREEMNALGDSINLVIVNSHGERGRRLRDSDRRLPDRILFSHFNAPRASDPDSDPDSEAGDPGIPESAVLTAADLWGHLRRMPLVRRPTVLLLACDMAPFRPGSTIPGAFFIGGARYVIATDSRVPAGTARRFGDAVVARLRRGVSPARAVFDARRALFDENGTIGPLLWNVVSAQGAGL